MTLKDTDVNVVACPFYYLSEIFSYMTIVVWGFEHVYYLNLDDFIHVHSRARSQAAARECHDVTRGHVTVRGVRPKDRVPLWT